MDKLFVNLQKVRVASGILGRLVYRQRKKILRDLARELVRSSKLVLAANRTDLLAVPANDPMRDRLTLKPNRLEDMVSAIRQIGRMSDPLGRILEVKRLPSGLLIKKISVPLGVAAVIYESRPNVTIDLAALAIKAGNGLVLKGGSESFRSNAALVRIIHRVLRRYHVPAAAVYLVDPKSAWQKGLLSARGLIDVVIPRGGAGLIEFVRKHSYVPVVETGAGVCHIFVDHPVDAIQAVRIIVNSKTQRPAVCNSLDTLVIHEMSLRSILPPMARALAEYGVEIFADSKAYTALKGAYPSELLRRARTEDFGREFLSLKLAIKTVVSFEAGLRFVRDHSSGHSEAILTKSGQHASRFMEEIDAAAVYHNASIRFTDGGEFGMGGEIGISTQKLHARGPMGAEALTSYKWLVFGQGQIRQ